MKELDDFGPLASARDGLRSSCRTCQAGFSRAYRAANRDKIAAYNRAYHSADPERAASRGRRWREENPEQQAERLRKWREENPERAAGHRRAAYRRRPDVEKARNAHNHGRRRAGVGADLSAQQVHRLLVEATLCPLCGVAMVDAFGVHYRPAKKVIDHITPIAVGGQHVRDNVRVICAKCNLTRGV